MSDAGSGSRIIRLRRDILLLFEKKSLETACFESLIVKQAHQRFGGGFETPGTGLRPGIAPRALGIRHHKAVRIKLYYPAIVNEELEIPAGFSPCELAAPCGRHLKFVAQPQRVYRVPRPPNK